MQPASGMVSLRVTSLPEYATGTHFGDLRACPLGTAQTERAGFAPTAASLSAEIHCAAVSQPAGKLAHYMILIARLNFRSRGSSWVRQYQRVST